uniref:Uncharacterized protein n=1 Tax=Macrostomum lignano TaxID=282301 RepID=A0A1I8FI68_9PLAT
MKAVVWVDAIQAGIMLAGTVAVLLSRSVVVRPRRATGSWSACAPWWGWRSSGRYASVACDIHTRRLGGHAPPDRHLLRDGANERTRISGFVHGRSAGCRSVVSVPRRLSSVSTIAWTDLLAAVRVQEESPGTLVPVAGSRCRSPHTAVAITSWRQRVTAKQFPRPRRRAHVGLFRSWLPVSPCAKLARAAVGPPGGPGRSMWIAIGPTSISRENCNADICWPAWLACTRRRAAEAAWRRMSAAGVGNQEAEDGNLEKEKEANLTVELRF